MQKQMDVNMESQKNKFNELLPPEPPVFSSCRSVINLSGYKLTDDQATILANCGNFAIIPKSIPVEEILANTEAAVASLPNSKRNKYAMKFNLFFCFRIRFSVQ